MQERRVQSLGQEDPLEKDVTNHSSILTWEIPGPEEPGRLEPMGLQRVRQDLATKQQKAKGLAQAQTRGLGWVVCPPPSAALCRDPALYPALLPAPQKRELGFWSFCIFVDNLPQLPTHTLIFSPL